MLTKDLLILDILIDYALEFKSLGDCLNCSPKSLSSLSGRTIVSFIVLHLIFILEVVTKDLVSLQVY